MFSLCLNSIVYNMTYVNKFYNICVVINFYLNFLKMINKFLLNKEFLKPFINKQSS